MRRSPVSRRTSLASDSRGHTSPPSVRARSTALVATRQEAISTPPNTAPAGSASRVPLSGSIVSVDGTHEGAVFGCVIPIHGPLLLLSLFPTCIESFADAGAVTRPGESKTVDASSATGLSSRGIPYESSPVRASRRWDRGRATARPPSVVLLNGLHDR